MVKKIIDAKIDSVRLELTINRFVKRLLRKRRLLMDLALLVVTILMISTEATILLFHFIFLLLTFGAFYWKIQSFVLRASFWITITIIVVLTEILAGRMHSEELSEIPLLVVMLVLVFVIAQQRSRVQEELENTNWHLEERVIERTKELGLANRQLKQEISERIQAEQELRRVATRNQAILDAIPDSILHLSRTGRLLAYKVQDSESPQGLMGTMKVGKDLNEMLPPELVDRVLQHIQQALSTGAIQTFEYQLPLSPSPRDFEAQLAVSGSDEVLVIVRDVTQRKARIAAVEQERSRIARDLHDLLGQNLGYICLKLDELSLNDTLKYMEPIQQDVARMRDAANDAYELVRNMLAAARPSNSVDLGTALLTQGKLVGSRASFKIQLTSSGQARPLSPIIQQQILYLFQEALNNVEKHAQAQQVDINLVWAEDILSITLSDNGCGFETNTPLVDGHFGLVIMQERAEEVNGFLSITSNPGVGTQLTFKLPLTLPNPSLEAN